MTSDLARAAVMMAEAHEPHQPNRRELSLWACKGIADPLTGYHCQFRGTAGEQFDHRIERVAAALLDAAPAGGGEAGDERGGGGPGDPYIKCPNPICRQPHFVYDGRNYYTPPPPQPDPHKASGSASEETAP